MNYSSAHFFITNETINFDPPTFFFVKPEMLLGQLKDVTARSKSNWFKHYLRCHAINGEITQNVFKTLTPKLQILNLLTIPN